MGLVIDIIYLIGEGFFRLQGDVIMESSYGLVEGYQFGNFQ